MGVLACVVSPRWHLPGFSRWYLWTPVLYLATDELAGHSSSRAFRHRSRRDPFNLAGKIWRRATRRLWGREAASMGHGKRQGRQGYTLDERWGFIHQSQASGHISSSQRRLVAGDSNLFMWPASWRWGYQDCGRSEIGMQDRRTSWLCMWWTGGCKRKSLFVVQTRIRTLGTPSLDQRFDTPRPDSCQHSIDQRTQGAVEDWQ